MDLVVHEFLDSECKFQLRCRSGGADQGLRALSYVFKASTNTEFVEWVNGIRGHETGGYCTDRDSLGGEPVGGRDDLEVLSQEQPQLPLGEFMYTTPPRTKHLILVRHGHYVNAHVQRASDTQQVLSQMGRQQAALTGKHLRAVHNRVPTRHDVSIYHSDMTRAVETAGIIAGDFGEVAMSPSSLLREGWPGKPYSSAFDVGETATARASDVMQEQTQVDVKRMEKAFQWFFDDSMNAQEENNEESYCILVCHANLIRFFLCRALGVNPATTWGHFEVNHCGVTRIDVCATRPIKVVAVNETGHLPQSLITSSEDHL
uniref:Serine/threonine-protein phosphatase PGAM5, mitochondrial n=1 Tax=Peronospora matthiolae TaxID=2874970 RepID=A0AAV1UXF9_9STRA